MNKDILYIDKANGIPCYDVTETDMEKVNAIYDEMFPERDIINQNTVYARKHSRIAGILGEVVFENVFPEAVKSTDITYDFVLDGQKVDVKCKYRTVVPRYSYEASFFFYQSSNRFNADMYHFMSTILDFSKVWLCGYGTKDEILNNAHMELWKAGETDTNNGMKFRQDTICLKYQYLSKVVI